MGVAESGGQTQLKATFLSAMQRYTPERSVPTKVAWIKIINLHIKNTWIQFLLLRISFSYRPNYD